MTPAVLRPRPFPASSATVAGRAGLLVLLVGALLAACGGDSASSPVTTTVTGPIATAPQVAGSGTSSPGASASASPGASGSPVVPAGALLTVLSPLGLNLRSGPSADAAVIGSLGRGVTLTVVGHQPGWYHVRGLTKDGYVTDNPVLVSGRTFNNYSSDARGFKVLYPQSWTFAESAPDVRFLPASGPALLVIQTAPTVDALGAPGRPGYGVSNDDTIVVYGITGVLRTYERSAGAPPATSQPLGTVPAGTPTASTAPATSQHFLEVLLKVTASYAMRIDFDYDGAADLATFTDMMSSVYIAAASQTPTPAAATT